MNEKSNKVNKKFILIIVAICLVLWGGKKLTETEFFMDKVAYPFAHNALKNALFRGNEVRMYSSELDSIWKKDIRKVILMPSKPSETSLVMINRLIKSNQPIYNDSTTFFAYPANSDSEAFVVRQYTFSSLPLKKYLIDMLYLNDIGGQVLIADIRRESGREENPDKYWYLIKLESPFNPIAE